MAFKYPDSYNPDKIPIATALHLFQGDNVIVLPDNKFRRPVIEFTFTAAWIASNVLYPFGQHTVLRDYAMLREPEWNIGIHALSGWLAGDRVFVLRCTHDAYISYVQVFEDVFDVHEAWTNPSNPNGLIPPLPPDFPVIPAVIPPEIDTENKGKFYEILL